MADEAFALSPIAARATQPGEADYEAIREAFMETARGRWFLGEYAKRNRNADTRMVLDAVTRIEETLVAQRLPELDDRLPEALAAIRSAVDEAAKAASTAIDGLELDDSLAPIRKGARIVKEISWRWREIGADSRICDLIDSQVSAIEGSCGQISERDPRPAVNGAFDLIRTRIDAFSDEDATAADPDDEKTVPPAADEVMESAAPAAAEPVASVIAAEPQVSAITAEPEVAAAVSAETAGTEANPSPDAPMTSAVAVVEVAGDMVAAADAPDETFLDETVLDEAVLGEVVLEDAVLDQTGSDQTVLDVTASDQAVLTTAVLDEAGLDEAVLDMVALAMAAPDPDGEIDYSVADPDEILEAPRAAPTTVAAMPQPAAPQMQVSIPQPSPPPAPQSIGSALLANGFLEQHRTPASDPLAPIRRMSQAEKIAFFS